MTSFLLRPCARRIFIPLKCNHILPFPRYPCIIPKRFQSTVSKQKPYYVTTPIFYVNAAPHVGHLYTLILSDILKRWAVLNGKEAILCTGTDEHGMKIQRAAEAAEIDTKAFCDQNAAIFKQLAESVNISNDHFVRTTDPDHRFAVQHFWMLLQERGFIYESKHEGWYSVSDETFYPESAVARALNNSTGKTFMASLETGKEVEWTSEINYHFKLSAFREPLLQFYKENPNFIVPQARMQQIIKSVEEGLSDLSISRPANRLTWGIPVPDDHTQTIYVWLDALINYLTKSGYPFQNPELAGAWPADVQVIGKDITRFHCIYWPAFLMALNIPPPKQILTHAHWTLGKRKMAKSTGNVVNPFFAMNRFGVDAMRFYLAHDGGIQDDADYDNYHITERYKKCLHGGVGGLLSRLTRTKAWNLKEIVNGATSPSNGSSCIAHIDSNGSNDDQTHLELLRQLPSQVTQCFGNLDSGAALKAIMETIFATNAYLQHAEPWNKTDISREQANRSLFLSVESLRICSILMQPYMPFKMEILLDTLGVAKEHRSFRHAEVGVDKAYGAPLDGVKIRKGIDGSLFLPMTIEWDDDSAQRRAFELRYTENQTG